MLRIRCLALAFAVGLILTFLSPSTGASQNEINGLKVITAEGKFRLEISTAGKVTFETFIMKEPPRFVIDCVGAKHDLPWSRRDVDNYIVRSVRTSQFRVDPAPVSRIVLDLGRDVEHRFWQEGDLQILELTAKDGNSMTEGKAALERDPAPEAAGLLEPASPDKVKPTRGAADAPSPLEAALGPILPLMTPSEKKNDAAEDVAAPKDEKNPEPAVPSPTEGPWLEEDATQLSPEAEKAAVKGGKKAAEASLHSVTASSNALPWAEPYLKGAPAAGGGVGLGVRKITLDAQGADIKTVLRTISEFSGKNIVYGPDVKGEVYVHMKDVPWEEALTILLKAHGFGYREEYGMIRVAEVNKLTKEELDLQTAERKKEDLLPLVTRIIFVHNSNAEEIKSALQNMITNRGEIDVDLASNAIIVNDIEKNVDKIEGMVKILDMKTYQVDINAKLVEVDVEVTREIGINWGMLNLHKAGFSGIGEATVTADIPVSSGTLKFGTVRSWGELNAILEALERCNKANIISNPRITTMDNREARILVGKEIPLIVADEAGNPITELTKIGIMLKVTPHVNSDKTITLDLHPEVSELQSESTAQGGVIIATSEADTRVVVSNGETAVIGGLIKKVNTDVRIGIPVLKDIPYLGALFSSTSTADKKQELVIFVTPTIIE